MLVGQREPGVSLNDGRIVDGNRRFTCLRSIQRESGKPQYFETVIMDLDIEKDKKQIKLLELAIQHGEEKKVDYDPIDYAIGTYHDVVQTQLLTVEEYAASANESVSDVKNRIEIAKMISEFLDYFCVPGQYHIAREYQVYSLFLEMAGPLKHLKDGEKQQLKASAFCNIVLKAIPDQRKYIRNIKSLIKNDSINEYLDAQKQWTDEIKKQLSKATIHSKKDLDTFAYQNMNISEELQLSMERALLRMRSMKLRNQASENVSKSLSLLQEIDTMLIGRMSEDEKDDLREDIDKLVNLANTLKNEL